jgi:hypothetical protein
MLRPGYFFSSPYDSQLSPLLIQTPVVVALCAIVGVCVLHAFCAVVTGTRAVYSPSTSYVCECECEHIYDGPRPVEQKIDEVL